MGEEVVYFHKEDEKLLKSLLKKVRAQASQKDMEGAAAAMAQDLEELNKIVGSKLTEDEKKGMLLADYYFALLSDNCCFL